jgi:hypothetical protein
MQKPQSHLILGCTNMLLPLFYKVIIQKLLVGDDLDDYPDSPGSAPQLSGEAASQLLDADDTAMDAAASGAGIT